MIVLGSLPRLLLFRYYYKDEVYVANVLVYVVFVTASAVRLLLIL